MADSTTATHNFILPEVGASKDTWGTKVNTNFEMIDSILTAGSNSLFLPRAGGDISGAITVLGNATYSFLAGQSDQVAKITRKSDDTVAYVFRADDAISGSISTLSDVLNTRMADSRYPRLAALNTLTAAQVLTAHPSGELNIGASTTGPLYIRRKSDDLVTHVIPGDDVTAPDTASLARSVLTRTMGDNRYVRPAITLTAGDGLSGGGTLAANRSFSVDSTVARKSIDNHFSVGQSVAGTLIVKHTGTANAHIYLRDTAGADAALIYASTNSDLLTIRAYAAGGASSRDATLNGANGNFTISGTFQGSGSGLTSLNASNISSGTIADARLPSTAVRTSRSITAGNGLSGGGDLSSNKTIALGTPSTLSEATTNSVTTSSHTHAIDSTIARSGRVVSAGSGLTGGGNLTVNRTISLGTPSTLSESTTNSVTTSSHTHAIDSTIARSGRIVSAGSGLTGGGDLTANRTISMGTPGTIAATSTNSVSTTSHTHELPENEVRLLMAQAPAGGVGVYSMLCRDAGNASDMGPGTTQPASVLRFVNASGVTTFRPSGTWMLHGFIPAGASTTTEDRTALWMRIA